jgi:hypothetical protein
VLDLSSRVNAAHCRSMIEGDLPDGQISWEVSGRGRQIAVRNAVRQKRDLSRPFKLIWPVQPHRRKYFAFSETRIATCAPSRARSEGRFAIVTNVGRGMRWTLSPRLTSAEEVDGKSVWS